MATHILRDSTGQDLVSFEAGMVSHNQEKRDRTVMHYFEVQVLNDLSGEKIDVAEDGETVIGTSPYTIKAGTRLYYDAEMVSFKSGKKYLSICIEGGEPGDLFEVRVPV